MEMMGENILLSDDYESEATKARLPYAVKKYATAGKNIPLKKNWCATWCTLTANFDKCLDEILNLHLRSDDVFVVTFMKSGTTWMQECAWLLLNNLDYEKSKESAVMIRSPFLEFQAFMPESPGLMHVSKQLNSPRLFKTHLPANLLPRKIWENKQKIIYVARNVKDVIVSSFHFLRNMNLYCGTKISDYVEDFLNNEMVYTHYWCHVIDFWRMRHQRFIFFVTYEEMQRNLAEVLQRLCRFLERPQLTKQELEQSIQHLSFHNMKTNKHNNLTYFFRENFPEVKEDFQFMRRGIVGSYKDELTPELIARIDKWSRELLDQYDIKEEDIFGKF